MDDDQLDDLKQFIAASVSQVEARLGDQIVSLDEKVVSLDEKVDSLRQETHEGFSGVGEAIAVIHEEMEKTNAAVDRRLTILEQQAT